jgi:aquaporin Z
VAGRINTKDAIAYIISQCLGAIVAAGILAILVSGKISGYDIAVSGLGQNGWGVGYGGGYNLISAIVFEFVASFLFIMVILESTQEGVPKQFAGLAIGIALAALVMFGLPITGTSVNPARSLGPAVIMGGRALAQVWLFLIVPSLSGVLAGLFFRKENVSLTSKVTPQA